MEKTLKPGRYLKEHMINEYADRLKDSSSIFVTDFSGLTNKEMEDLRKKLRSASARYLIVKNSMCKLALHDLKYNELSDMITGSCALSYGTGDPVTVSKALVDFAKNNKNLKLRGAYLEGEIISQETVQELASLPPREVLIARLASCMNSPINGLVLICSGIVKKLLYAINEIIKRKK